MTQSTTKEPAPRILPPLNAINRSFWTGGAEGKLLILRNKSTGQYVHPPESLDEEDPELVPEAVSGKGTIFTFTINQHAYNPAVPPPYVIALVELNEQKNLRVPANIVNCDMDAVHIGMPVRVAFEQQDEFFVPVFEPDN